MVHEYWTILEKFDKVERSRLSNAKRLLDLYHGYPAFRTALATSALDTEGEARAFGWDGVQADLEDMRRLILQTDGLCACEQADHPAETVTHLWQRYRQHRIKAGAVAMNASHEPGDLRFAAWRSRQVARLSSELGSGARKIPHSFIAFELSRGCSVGCSFCGIDAAKFGGYAKYTPEQANDWNIILAGIKNQFGSALASGFLYWGTDPLDNPDYMLFAKDFYRHTGMFPQVTTAIPLRNLELTRAVLSYSPLRSMVSHRFSILSLNIFKRVMKTFTPEEMLHVEMVMQHPEANWPKALAGRNRDFDDDQRQSTIACVTGFLINIAERRVRMISPTRASERWPNGYIEFADTRYLDAQSCVEEIGRMTAQISKPIHWQGGPMGFRHGLKFEREGLGFKLSGPSVTHSFRDFGSTAEIVASGVLTYETLLESAPARQNSKGEEAALLQGLFNAGLVVTQLDRCL